MAKVKIYTKVKKHCILDKNLNASKKLSNHSKILSEIKSYNIIKDKYYGPKIYNFVKYLISQNVNITHLCNNLKTLKIQVQNEEDFPSEYHQACYDFEKNIIFFKNFFNEASLCHELFHVASTYYNEDKTLLFSGFSFLNLNSSDKFFFCSCINDGYTHKLENDFFSQDNGSYYQTFIVEKLTKLVGTEQLKQLYFNGDLVGLINSLEKYEKKDDIYEFIENLDYVNNILQGVIDYNDNLKIIIEEKLVQINQFLVNCFYKKNSDNSCFYKNKFELLRDLIDLPTGIKCIINGVNFTINNVKIKKTLLNDIMLEEQEYNESAHKKYKFKSIKK